MVDNQVHLKHELQVVYEQLFPINNLSSTYKSRTIWYTIQLLRAYTVEQLTKAIYNSHASDQFESDNYRSRRDFQAPFIGSLYQIRLLQ